ncbi:MAG TPA: hypothetical protein VGN17_31135 [Bryobacteraceae bacterium]
MNRSTFTYLALAGALLAPAAAYAQVSCTREGLKAAADLYVAAQTKGDPSGLPLAKGLGYIENFKPTNIDEGLIKKPIKLDHQRTLIDTATCQTFTEMISADKAAPYAFGTRLRVNHGLIAEIEMMWTTTGYWGFNADAYLKYASAEEWNTIPAAKRDTRDTLEAAANAYLDAFLEGKGDLVPWGYPCNRTEGGMHTGKGAADDSCQVGVPSGVNISNRHFVVDESIGAVVAFCTFGAGNASGGSGAPDTHLFRVENGKLRYVHTLTHLLQANGPGRGAAPNQGKAAPTNNKQ